MRRTTTASAALVAVAGGVAAVAMTGSAAVADGEQGAGLAEIRQATQKYHDVTAATRDGYLPTNHCVPGMGFHYLKPANAMRGPEADLSRPTVLLYAPSGADGTGRRLVGVEWVKFTQHQPPAGGTASPDAVTPTVLGHRFEGPMAGHEPGMGWHYDKHVWVWQGNPNGTFAQENPKVTCS